MHNRKVRFGAPCVVVDVGCCVFLKFLKYFLGGCGKTEWYLVFQILVGLVRRIKPASLFRRLPCLDAASC